MPYVRQDFRDLVDVEIDTLLEKLQRVKNNCAESALDGEVNYTITRILDALYGMGGYYMFNRAMGVIDCVGREFYRRRVAPYEDIKRNENGDVYKGLG